MRSDYLGIITDKIESRDDPLLKECVERLGYGLDDIEFEVELFDGSEITVIS